MSYSVRVVAKHQTYSSPVPYKLIKVNNKTQLSWGVIKFLILKNIFKQYKCKTYDWDLDGYILNEEEKCLEVDTCIQNNSIIVYKKIPIGYRERVHFVPHAAVGFTLDINMDHLQVEYY